ncbi:MAG: hypothetical protein ABF248_06605 [Yoonia sp.]
MSIHNMLDGITSVLTSDSNQTNSTLVIGDMTRWKSPGRDLPDMVGLQFIDIHALDQGMINTQNPDIILSPLVSDDFDAIEVASLLSKLSYNGAYRALTDEVPNPALIKAEVRRHAPNLDFDLVVLPMHTSWT